MRSWSIALVVAALGVTLIGTFKANAATSVAYIYNNGALEWRSWSWGLQKYDLQDAGFAMPGARAALCLTIQPFGALSLKSSMPFSLDGSVLGLYIRGSGYTTAAALGALEFQFESSSPSRYAITRSHTLAEILEAQALAEGGNAAELLAGIAAGGWVPVKVDLSVFDLAPDAAQNTGSTAAAPFRADRLTMGSCLQRFEGCGADKPTLDFCLDKVVIVNAA